MKRFLTILIFITFSFLAFGCKEKQEKEPEAAVKTEKKEIKEDKTDSEEKKKKEKPKRELTAEEQEVYDKLVKIVTATKDSLPVNWTEMEETKEVKIPGGETIDFPDVWVSFSYSENGKYVALTGDGPDTSFSLTDFESLEQIVAPKNGITFRGWEENTYNYDTKLWAGSGYSICQEYIFDNGEIKKGEQYFGRNSLFGDPGIFCSGYKANPLATKRHAANLRKLLEEMKNQKESNTEFSEVELGDISESIVLISNDYSEKDLKEFIEKINQLYPQLSLGSLIEGRMAVLNLIEEVYPILEDSVEKGILSQKDLNIFTEDYLEFMEIDKELVPWLFE